MDTPRDDTTTERPMRPFFILWTGQALSIIGSQAVQFALIWWLTEQTGSATVLATAALVGLVPQVALGPLIGALVDRWNRKTVMLLAVDGVAAGLVAVADPIKAGAAAAVGHLQQAGLRVIMATATKPTQPRIVTPAAASMMPGSTDAAIKSSGAKISASATTKNASAAYCAGTDCTRCATCEAPQPTSMKAPSTISQLLSIGAAMRSEIPDWKK